MRRLLLLGGLLGLALGSSGCLFTRVQPWERDLLAEPEMLAAPDPLETSLDEHVYFSKETAHGGAGVGGGGCGCN
ncbi:MAG: DUF4266 domain-containing protein [Candidatus Delongbacteria bacterium]